MRIWAFPAFYPIDHPGMKWHGIFAHRQNKGLVESGADLQVIQPVMWHPQAPFHHLNKQWKKLAEMPYPDVRVYDGITVNHPKVGNMKPSRIYSSTYAERYVNSIVDFFKNNKITLHPTTDIFYSQWLPTAGWVQIAAHKLGLKSAVLAIGDDVIVWPKESAQNLEDLRKTWTEADYRIGVAAYLAEEANTLIGKKLPYYVVRRGVEHNNFVPVTVEQKYQIRQELNLPQDKILIFSVGSSLVRKGWLDLLDALAEIKKLRNDFVLVGVYAGSEDINLATEASKRGLTDMFIDLGEVEPQKINKLYGAADIFCLPSHWEGIANAVVEAMSCGLPVVTTNVCGHPELITNGSNGILVPPKRPDLVSKELLKLLQDKQLRDKMGATARNFIVNEWGSFAQNSAKLYKILCG